MTINFKDYIASVKDFPEPGIIFRDISPLMADGKAYAAATDEIAAYAQDKGVEMIVGPEARGFIVGCPVAYKLGIGFAPARKKANYRGQPLKPAMILNTVRPHFTYTRTPLNRDNGYWYAMTYWQLAARLQQQSV